MTTVEFDNKLLSIYDSLRPGALKLTRNLEEANDLLQETLLKAISNRDKFSEGTNLKAWLYTIMKNTFITNYHRLVKRNTFIDTTQNLHYLNSSSQSIENKATSKMFMDEIHRAIQGLSHEYKTPFMMHYQGYKYREIADILKLPMGTVKNRIHVARKELKGTIEKHI